MKNEFGVALDSNGYAPSIMPNKKDMFGHPQCYYCLNGHALVRHEVLYGQNRTKSKSLGLWILVCPDCHRWIHGEKQCWPEMEGLDAGMRLELKLTAQRMAMIDYSWTKEEFARRFGKNYLED